MNLYKTPLNQDTVQKLERIDDPWDRANSEFESSPPVETEIVHEKKYSKSSRTL